MNSKSANGLPRLKTKKSPLPNVKAKGPGGNQPKISCSVGKEFVRNGKRYIRILDGNTIRDILLPCKETYIPPVVLPTNEYEAIKKTAFTNADEELKKEIELDKRLERESKERAERFKIVKPPESVKPPELPEKTVKRCEAADEKLLENEEEIKKVNSLIIGAQCRTIMDKQLRKNRRITSTDSVGRERVQKETAKKVVNKFGYIKELMKQIEERRLEKEIIKAKASKEHKKFNKILLQIELNNKEMYKDNLKKQAGMRARYAEINAANEALRIIDKQEDRMEDLKIIAQMKEADERATKRNRELKEMREKREKAIAAMIKSLEEASQRRALKQKLEERRIELLLDSEWRKKERAKVIKKIEDVKKFKAGVDKQLYDIARLRAGSMQRDKEEYFKIIKIRDELYKKDLELEKRRNKANEECRMILMRQVNDGELAKIEARRQKFHEGEMIKLNVENRELAIKNYMKKKLDNARSNNVCDIYLKKIEHDLKLH